MPAGEEWVQQKLEQIAHKREVLATLKDSLDAWERDVDWGELAPAKREALLRLARESAEALRLLISRVNNQIAAGLRDLADSTNLDRDA
jgi:hypothetical protein